MATKTDFLKLVLPANDEYKDTWDQVLNNDLGIVDAWAMTIQEELNGAHFNFSSLGEFLTVGHYADGTNKPTVEGTYSRNSKVYGDSALLYDRLEFGDFETFHARNGLASLQASLANQTGGFDHPNTVISGNTNCLAAISNYFAIAATLVEPVVLNVNGYYLRIRENINTTASGSVGTKYLVATKPTAPIAVVDRSTQTTGALSLNGDKLQMLQDPAVDFTAHVVPGDVLEILNGNALGKYVVSEVAPGNNVNRILIKGLFNGAAGYNVNYKIYDPFAASLEVSDIYVAGNTRCTIGEASWNGTSLTSAVLYAFKGNFESSWIPVDVSVTDLLQTISHNLGSIPRSVTLLASQVDDDSGFVEILSTGEVDNQLTVTINNTLIHTPGTIAVTDTLHHTPGTLQYSDVDSPADVASFTPGALTGTVAVALTPGALTGDVTGQVGGSIRNSRSMRIKMSRTQLIAKNPTTGLFYIDFGNFVKTSGFLKVICEK